MTDDPLAGLRAWIQEAGTRMEDIEETLRNQERALMSLRSPTPEEVKHSARESLGHELEAVEMELKVEEHMDVSPNWRENLLLAQIQRMANTTAALQRELAKVAMERDEARARTGQWNTNLSLLSENEGLKRELEAERAEKTKCKEGYESAVLTLRANQGAEILPI
jgi:hypothetical protein